MDILIKIMVIRPNNSINITPVVLAPSVKLQPTFKASIKSTLSKVLSAEICSLLLAQGIIMVCKEGY